MRRQGGRFASITRKKLTMSAPLTTDTPRQPIYDGCATIALAASAGATYDEVMLETTFDERRRLESLDAAALERLQLDRLNRLLRAILPQNRFYADKLRGQLEFDSPAKKPLVRSLAEFATWPFTYKDELINAQHPAEPAANLTFPRSEYVRYHQTSGTRGRPLVVLDTADDWKWWLESWQFVLDAAEMTPGDVALMAFSFGPFIGFWSAFEAASARGCLVVPTGGAGTIARLELIRSSQARVVFCTPSYALHMGEVGADHGLDVGQLGVDRLVLAGEPGGSIPEVRQRIEGLWRARIIDHAGATEVGPWGYSEFAGGGLYLLESEFIGEFLNVETGQPAASGELAELVLTSLGRVGAPVIRYRTGDLVRPSWTHSGRNRFVFLEGGVLGRSDDMLIVRGVNVFPTALEQILRSFPEVVEYRVTVSKAAEMDRLLVEIEDHLEQPQRVAEELQLRLGLRAEVVSVAIGILPRFEGKGRRIVDLRRTGEKTR